MSEFIYILQLGQNKWYVGRTNNLQQRIQQHMDNEGCEWTKLYGFISVESTSQGNGFDEDKITLECMDTYGIENVRGGIYSNIDLSLEQMLTIRKQLNHNKNLCLACGSASHYIGSCFATICYRCGRPGHKSDECQETTHFYNGKLDGCYRCGRSDHWKWRCNRSKDIFGRNLTSASGIAQIYRGLFN